MNVQLTENFIVRAKKCVFELGNKTDFYKKTGTHFSTLERMIARGWGSSEVVARIEKYCDAVEGLTPATVDDK